VAAQERLDAAARGAPAFPHLPLLIAGAALFAVLLVAGGSASALNASLGLALAAGLVGLGAIARFAPRTLCGVLLLCLAGSIAIPIDKSFAYHDHLGGWPGLRFAVADIPLLLLAVVAPLGALLGRIESGIPRRVVALMALLLFWYTAAALGAPNKTLAGFEIAATLHSFLIAWIVASLFRRNLLGAILALLALQVTVHGAFAIAQGVTGRPIGTTLVGELIVTDLVKFHLGGEAELRPAGLFPHPIVLATYLVITLPLLAARLATQRGIAMRLLLLAAIVTGGAGLVFSLARGAWISLTVAMVVLAVLALRSRLLGARQLRAIAIGGFALALVFGAAFAPRIYNRFTKADPSSLASRFDMDRIALRMIAANPVFGTGPNNYILTSPAYDTEGTMSDFHAPVHNVYFLEAAESGIPALLLLLALFGSFLLTGLHYLPRMHDPELAWVVAALLAALVGLLVTQLADFSARLEPLRSMIWFQVGLLFGVLQADRMHRVAGRPAARV